MSTPTGSTAGKAQSGVPSLQINNQPLGIPRPDYVKPVAVETGEPMIEITCSNCGELTSRTYPTEINGEMVTTAPNEIYTCSCPS